MYVIYAGILEFGLESNNGLELFLFRCNMVLRFRVFEVFNGLNIEETFWCDTYLLAESHLLWNASDVAFE